MYEMIMMPLWSHCKYSLSKVVSICLFYSNFFCKVFISRRRSLCYGIAQMAFSNARSEYLCLSQVSAFSSLNGN